jgi:serine/threonine-protein kinase
VPVLARAALSPWIGGLPVKSVMPPMAEDPFPCGGRIMSNNNNDLQTLVSLIKDNRLLDATELTHLDQLQSRCSEPGELAKQLMERGSLTRFQTEQLFTGQGSKLVLGQYILLEPLGEGGMGQVYKARHIRMKRVVALKIIRKDMAAGSMALQRFNQEIEAAAQLVHPNVVIAYDANEVDNVLFFVMEFVEGIDLGKLVQRFGKVPVGNAADYICQAAAGLQHAHERGMVHRDIKPSNLLLAYVDSTVKILDMGLARLREKSDDPNRQLTFTGMVMGTPDFISPEQAKDSRMVDIRSDLYSLGCTFYYLLAGRVPFLEGTFTEKLLKHTLEEPTPLEELCPDLAPEVLAIVKKLMAKKPDDRYQTPAELIAALKPFATPERNAERFRAPKEPEKDPEWKMAMVSPEDATLQRPAPGAKIPTDKTEAVNDSSAARPLGEKAGAVFSPTLERIPNRPGKEKESDKTAPEPAEKGPRRPRSAGLLRALVAGVGAIALAGAVVLAWKAYSSVQGLGSHVVVITTANNPPPATTRPTEPATVKETKPDTKPIVDTKPDTKPVKPEPPLEGIIVEIREKDDEHKNDPLRAAISPDGRWLVAGWNDFLWTYNLDKSKPGSAADGRLLDQLVYSVAIANDGRVLLGTTHEMIQPGKVPRPVPVLTLWDPSSKEVPRRFSGLEKEASAITFSREGFRALTGGEDRSVRLWDLRTGKELKVLRKHDGKVNAVAISPDGTKALSAARDNRLIYWDLETGNPLHIFPDHGGSVTAVTFSPDGKFAVSGSYDRKVILWDLEKHARVRSYEAHKEVIWALAFSPDGKRFLSGGDDQVIYLWSVDTAEYLGKMPYHKGSIASVAFAADGKYALSVSTDHTARRWKLPEAKGAGD